MASPPYNLDISDPTDGSLGSAFPANERTFRDNINSYINTEHDINTGYHKFQELSTSSKNALSTPPTGMIVYDTTLSVAQINTGTSISPVWTNLVATANASGWLYQFKANGSTSYSAVAADSGTSFTSNAAGGALTVTLPNTSSINIGWYACFVRITNGMTAAVQGSHSEKIRIGTVGLVASAACAAADGELFILVWDGIDWLMVSATPATWDSLGAFPARLAVPTASLLGGAANTFTSITVGSGLTLAGGVLSANGFPFHTQVIGGPFSGTFTIPATTVRVTCVGAGAGGGSGGSAGGGGGGGAGSIAMSVLTGLTVGNTLSVTVTNGGAGGTGGTGTGNDGSDGGTTTVASGTQSITSIVAPGGSHGNKGTNSAQGNGGIGGRSPIAVTMTAPGADAGQGAAGSTGQGGNPGFAAIWGFFGQGGYGSSAAATSTTASAGTEGIAIFEWTG